MEVGADLFSIVPEGRTNEFKLQGRFQINILKSFLMVQSVRRWKSLPQKVVDFPSLDIFMQRLDNHLLRML